MFDTFLNRVAQWKIIPVITLEDAGKANDLATALATGGLPIAEVTFRTENAVQTMKTMADRGDILVGAGTVRSLDQAKKAVDAGASFLVSPGFNTSIVSWAVKHNLPVLPGIDSTLGIEMAVEQGLNTVKFFPAGTSGGLDRISALYGPYHDIRFVPTGGINANNLAEWLTHPAVIACGGSWLVTKNLLAQGNWEKIVTLTREALKTACA